MHRQMQQEDPKSEILEALRMTDRQKKGYIQASELRAKLTILGEKLTDKEGKVTAGCEERGKVEKLCTMCFFFEQRMSCCVDAELQQKTYSSINKRAFYTL